VSQASGNEHSAGESGAIRAPQALPSRISVSVSGFEWFIYNRSPAYEAIARSRVAVPGHEDGRIKHGNVDQATKSDTVPREVSSSSSKSNAPEAKEVLTRPSTKSTSGEYSTLTTIETETLSNGCPQADGVKGRNGIAPTAVKSTGEVHYASASDSSGSASLLMLSLFPILIECQKGAIVMGNEHTRAILTTSFERSKGHIDAAASGPLDLYRQIFEFEVVHPIVQMRPNPDYRQSQQAAAQSLINTSKSARGARSWWKINWRFRTTRRKMLYGLRNLTPYFRKSVESFRPSSAEEKNNIREGNWPNELPGESRWLGLSRYLDENERDDHEGWSNVEYARFSNIVECPSVSLSFFWDVPGTVRPDQSPATTRGEGRDINVAKAPAYGLDLVVRGGNINYGPWADRARAEFQSVFFPNPHQDAVPAKNLGVGASRQSTVFNINIQIENETTLRIPTKENSKDWQWKGRSGALRGASAIKQSRDKKHVRKKKDDKNLLGPDVRPFGWLAVSVSANSTITYNMDMVARKQGYHNNLELTLKGTTMNTSVNHALLWRCGPQKISCDLSNPLDWNGSHHWTFDVQSQGMELFLLRDHVFLLVDLISDFTSGPPGGFLPFVPFQYRITLSFTDLKLYLNANDSNIIDNPCDFSENTFLMLHGRTLNASVDIPLEYYAPSANRVLFKAEAHDARLDLATPVWNTVHSFASHLPTATLRDFSMDGCYNYCSGTSPNLTDSLFLNLRGFSPRIYLHGFLIRYCMKLKDNYFGDDMHFRTLEEYQGLLSKQKDNETEQREFQNKKGNDLDVILNVTFDQATVLLPANIYSRKENLRLDLLLIEADMRFTNYYMDLDAKFSPVEATFESLATEDVGIEKNVSNTQAFVDGICIYGHRLFGSAPSEPTYVCNWDFDVGKVVGECSTEFVRVLLQAVRSFAFTFDDDENALPVSHVPVIHDVTFLRARVDSIGLSFLLESTAILFGAQRIDVTFNDWAGVSFSERLHLEIPGIELAAVDLSSAIRHKDKTNQQVLTHAVFDTSLLVKMVERKRDFAQDRALQQQHVRFHDQRTHRTTWLLHDHHQALPSVGQPRKLRLHPPAMPVPNMPMPLTQNDAPKPTHRKEAFQPALRRKSSFLSYSSSGETPSLQSKRQSSRGAIEKSSQSAHRSLSRPVFRTKSKHETKSSKGPASLWWERRRRLIQKVQSRSPTGMTYSSPWTPPHFSLQQIVPDTSDLPPIPETASFSIKKHTYSDALENTELADEDSTTVHTRLHVELGHSVRGFASPDFFAAVASLLKTVQPVHPTDLLDDLQVKTISELVKFAKIRLKVGSMTDCLVRIPMAQFRMVNSDSQQNSSPSEVNKDQYDFQIEKAQLIFRSRTEEKPRDDHPALESALRLHLVADRCHLKIHDRSPDAQLDKAAAKISFEELVLWMASDDRTITKLQLRDLEATSWGSRIEYLASLIHRTVDTSESIIGSFNDLDSSKRLRSLIYHLTVAAEGISDPTFLTRPSYVLRTAESHVRLSDSWKLASRLRHMLQSLDSLQQTTIWKQCISSEGALPPDAETRVLTSFDNWRSWDLAHVRKSLIMGKVWPHLQAADSTAQQQGTFLLDLILERARFFLDPGPRVNQIGIQDISTAISIKNDTSKSIDGPRIVTVQTFCSRFGLHLNWEFVELIGDTMALFVVDHKTAPPTQNSSTPEQGLAASERQLHIVLGIDSGVITLDSINVTAALAASGLKASFLHQVKPKQAESYGIILTSQSASARLRSNEKMILGWLLDKSTLSMSHCTSIRQETDSTVMRATGNCKDLRFEMTEDISGSLEIANRVIRDEVNIIGDLASRVSGEGSSDAKSQPVSRKGQQDFYVALFLEQYTLSVAILPLLTYVISGKVARTSIVPRSSSTFAINFDLQDHSHAFKVRSRDGGNQAPILNMPPTNGRVLVSRSSNSTTVNVDTTLEKVELTARAVRSFVDTVNQPEVVRAFLSAKKSAQEVSSQLNALFPTPSEAVAKPSGPPAKLLYTANVTFIGFGVHASAPAMKSGDYRADLDFFLGLTTIHLRNQRLEEGMVFDRPQFEVRFRHIGLDLCKRSRNRITNYGSIRFSAQLTGKTRVDEKDNHIQTYHAASDGVEVDLYAQTASLVVDIAAHLQENIKSLKLSEEVKRLRPLRRLTTAGLAEPPTITVTTENDEEEKEDTTRSNLFDSIYSLALDAIKIAWRLEAPPARSSLRDIEDLVFSIEKVNLSTKREGSATLSIANLLLQMVPKSADANSRSSNSALMPEVVFKVAYLSTKRDRRLAFQAAGKALELRLASDFIVPATTLRASLGAASADLREGEALWAAAPVSSKKETPSLFSSKYLASLLIDADFAGAVVNVQARRSDDQRKSVFGILKGDKRSRAGRYNQAVQGDAAGEATLRAPGVAMKLEYSDNGQDDPTLNAEIKVAASSNVLYPSVVPLITEISSSVKEIVGNSSDGLPRPMSRRKSEVQKATTNSGLASSDPANLLGRCKLNLGLWIREQDFTLSCQPIARVAATARLSDIFIAMNTVQSPDQERFFALSTTFNNLHASVQHVYSRESTASFEVDSIVLSMMNSKHVSKTTGISAILNVSPMKTSINAKQLQDFLLFREIWYPAEFRQAPSAPGPATSAADSQALVVQRYQQVAAAGAFPWNAVVSVQELVVELDLGQSLGKSVFTISKLWASSKKASDFEQNLCLGFEKVGIESTGRMSGFIELQNFRVRTSIRWPQRNLAVAQTPLVQASLSLDQLRVKAAFDYQPFAIADISKFDFLMYNVRPSQPGEKDRLVGTLEGDKVQVFCTTATASQALALYQAVVRLIQEKEVAYESSLRELDKYLRRKSIFPSSTWTAATSEPGDEDKESTQGPFSLHTDVVVTLRAVNIGAFPSTFFDNQIFKIEATDAQARFAVSAKEGKTHSALGLTLGQLRIALANVNRATTQALGEVSVGEVVSRATNSRGGTILKVPKVVAAMQTWQSASSHTIEYTFKSTFEGKVDVGWNYSRISFIRGMWSTHSRALASRLGKPLPQSAVQITGGPQPDDKGEGGGQEKITAVVNVPQSKFEYKALEPPIIDTPQLRDMGEATPPLEWIGLHRDKLPNVTHQIIIVTLLEVAKEVEDAYSKILGSSQ
jgi:hypothetical protein